MSTPTITAAQVKELRDRTGAGMMDCKKALSETNGDVDAAAELLRVRLGDKALKMGGREATEGTVQAYIHANSKVGVLIEVDCNTDFVARDLKMSNTWFAVIVPPLFNSVGVLTWRPFSRPRRPLRRP